MIVQGRRSTDLTGGRPVFPAFRKASVIKKSIVLVVGDERGTREVVKQNLPVERFYVIEAEHPTRALEIANLIVFDLLIVDVLLQKSNGRDLARKLSAAQPRMKVLFVSGYSREVLISHGVFTTGLDLISKPFSQAELLARVDALVGTTHSTGIAG